jgi:hypothetical protein
MNTQTLRADPSAAMDQMYRVNRSALALPAARTPTARALARANAAVTPPNWLAYAPSAFGSLLLYLSIIRPAGSGRCCPVLIARITRYQQALPGRCARGPPPSPAWSLGRDAKGGISAAANGRSAPAPAPAGDMLPTVD